MCENITLRMSLSQIHVETVTVALCFVGISYLNKNHKAHVEQQSFRFENVWNRISGFGRFWVVEQKSFNQHQKQYEHRREGKRTAWRPKKDQTPWPLTIWRALPLPNKKHNQIQKQNRTTKQTKNKQKIVIYLFYSIRFSPMSIVCVCVA